MMNTSLILIKPNACRDGFLNAARNYFHSNGIRVEDMLRLTGPQVRRGAYVERHYSSLADFSGCPSEDLSMFVSEETATLFFAAFGELWETVVGERRVLTPNDAMTVLGLTLQELDEQWWASKLPVRLEHGFYVSYFEEESLYVINGFFPRLLVSFTAVESQVCCFIVSWPESKYSWKSFRQEILGVGDPSEAKPTSLRRLLYDHWEEYGLNEEPSRVKNGFDSASGPLEALAHRFIWFHRRATEDDYGRTLLRDGVSLDFLERLVKNPTLVYRGERRPVFELLENMQSSEVLHHVAILCAMEKKQRDARPSSCLTETGTVGGTTSWTVVLDDEDVEERRNRAVVFVKPHANTPETRSLVEERLMQVKGMQVLNHRHVLGNEIAERQLMDKQYRIISRYAVRVSSTLIKVSTQNRALFREAFGVTWEEALRSGRVWNAEEAMRVLGDISAEQLYRMWGSCTKTVKLTSGTYVAHFCNESAFIINGFYPYLRETYTAEHAKVTCYMLSWPETCLTWKKFQDVVIGKTNPRDAHPSSLRGLIRDRWQDLGMQHPPTTMENGVHASAGPLEAVLERHLWTCSPLSYDPLMLRLQEFGLTGALLFRWQSNPEVVLGGAKKRSGCVFDLLKNVQTSEMVDIMREEEKQTLVSYTEKPVNRSVVIIRSFAVNKRTIETVRDTLNKAGVVVVQEESLFSTQVAELYLKSPSFIALEKLADSNAASLRDGVSMPTKHKFREHFLSAWDGCLTEETLLGAIDACRKLQLTPRELLQLWDASTVVEVGPACYVAEVMPHTLVINGFVPFLRESYGRPGSCCHVFSVEWEESLLTWCDFCESLIGDANRPCAAAQGSLQRTFADAWKDFGLQLPPVSRTTAVLYASQGPLEAVADREMWLGAELPEDPFVQHLLLDGVPLPLVLHYVKKQHCSKCDEKNTKCSKDRSDSIVVTEPTRRDVSRRLQSSQVVLRLKALTSRFLRGMKMNYAFIWVKPHACTAQVAAWIPSVLEEHRLELLSSGHLSMDEVIKKQLVEQQYAALYRNAMTRNVVDIPITSLQMSQFESTFGITWATALNLHAIVNATQALQRVGVVRLLDEWNMAEKKVCLSSSLYVAYFEEEGLYVVNGFYPYLRSRMYTGTRIMWYIVSWDEEIMTWDEFQRHVIGGELPLTAEAGSLRHTLLVLWETLGLQRQPDGIENGFHASASPIEGLADRVSWLGVDVGDDIFGRLLIQGGVSAEYLRVLLHNPLARHRDEPVGAVSDVFDKLCTENPLLFAQLIGLQSTGGIQFFASHPNSSKSLTLSLVHNTTGVSDDKRLEGYLLESPKLKRTPDFAPTTDVACTATQLSVSFTRNYAFLLVNPKCLSTETEEHLTAYIVDFLQYHKMTVENTGSINNIPTALRHMVGELQWGVFRYASQQSPYQYAMDSATMAAFRDAFGEAWNPKKVRNAVDAAVEFNMSTRCLKEAWDACTMHKCIAPFFYVGKMHDRDLYLVNGFAPYSAEVFNTSSTVKRYFLVSWENTEFDYAHYLQHVIGDPYVEKAKSGSLHRLLCDEWEVAGLKCPPDPFEGAIWTSTSALEAMRQRQLWLSLGLSHDTVGRFATEKLGISPYVLRRAVANPRTGEGDGRFLYDKVWGKGSSEVLPLLLAEDARHRMSPVRNSAFVLIKSRALCRPFAMTIEQVFSRANVRIEEEGNITGTLIRGRDLVYHLYPAASKYATCDVRAIRLTNEERDMVKQQLGVSWDHLINARVIFNAYDALQVLGALTPQHLSDRWNASQRKVIVRPDLMIAELMDHGIFVLNGFFPELKRSLESLNTMLHWYVVSWSEEFMKWSVFLEEVIGAENPEEALPKSIRGELFQRWREYGLVARPDAVHNGLHVSQGALQAVRERSMCLHHPLSEDYLGDIMLRQGVSEKILQVWLGNPEVTSGGVVAGLFEHLGHCDASRLLNLLTLLTNELQSNGDEDVETAAHIPAVEGETGGQFGIISLKPPAQEKQLEENMNDNAQAETGEALLFRNFAVIIVKPHVSENLKLLSFLETFLSENGIRIKHALCKQSLPQLVAKHFSSAIHYASHDYSSVCPEVTEKGRACFYDAFGEQWECAVYSGRVLGAFDALKRFSMTPSQLYVKWSMPEHPHVQLAHDMKVMKFHTENVYVVNAFLPLERERLIQAGSGNRDIHCHIVSWDQRRCSWNKFLAEVIGDKDPANAAPTSFRGHLYKRWEEFGLPSRPNRIDNLVLASEGPLQAFVERELWCGTCGLDPDPLIGALSYVDNDGADMLEWKHNPIVRYIGRKGGDEDSVVGRIFGLTYGLDTREFVELVAERDGFFLPISMPPGADGVKQEEKKQTAERSSKKHRLQVNSTAARAVNPAEWLQNALLSGKDEDVVRLWLYYGGGTAWTDGDCCAEQQLAQQHEGSDAVSNYRSSTPFPTATLSAIPPLSPWSLRGCINGKALRMDVEALECFGLPLAKSTVKKLFGEVSRREDGHATYEEFRRILAVLQQL